VAQHLPGEEPLRERGDEGDFDEQADDCFNGGQCGLRVAGLEGSGNKREATEYGFACPGALWCGSLYQSPFSYSGGAALMVTGTYPSLCQATVQEHVEFDRSRQAAQDELDARLSRKSCGARAPK
jgi:hypothetical protein